jgi:hypothetical protein
MGMLALTVTASCGARSRKAVAGADCGTAAWEVAGRDASCPDNPASVGMASTAVPTAIKASAVTATAAAAVSRGLTGHGQAAFKEAMWCIGNG